MGIVHNAAAYLPELVKYFGVNHPNLAVKVSSLYKKSDLETLKMEEFSQRVQSSYSHGTYRSGPLLQFSLVGTVQEESGGYFPEFLDLLEQCLFLKETMPWGSFSALNLPERNKSNDGPILWVRPGEQVVPTAESKSPYKKRRYGYFNYCFLTHDANELVHVHYAANIIIIIIIAKPVRDLVNCISLLNWRIYPFFSWLLINRSPKMKILSG